MDIRIPKHVSDEARQHYEALKALELLRRMNLNKYTEKAQEAIARRPAARRAGRQSRGHAGTSARRAAAAGRRDRARGARQDGRRYRHVCWPPPRRGSRSCPRRAADRSRACRRVCGARLHGRRRRSRPHERRVHEHRAPARGDRDRSRAARRPPICCGSSASRRTRSIRRSPASAARSA